MFDFSSIVAFYSSIAIFTRLFNVEGAFALVNTFTFGVNKLIYFVRDIFSISAAGVLIMPSLATAIASWFLVVTILESKSRAFLGLIFRS